MCAIIHRQTPTWSLVESLPDFSGEFPSSVPGDRGMIEYPGSVTPGLPEWPALPTSWAAQLRPTRPSRPASHRRCSTGWCHGRARRPGCWVGSSEAGEGSADWSGSKVRPGQDCQGQGLSTCDGQEGCCWASLGGYPGHRKTRSSPPPKAF